MNCDSSNQGILASCVVVTVSNLGQKFIIFLCNKSFAAKCVAMRAEKFRFPDILRLAKSGGLQPFLLCLLNLQLSS